MRAEVSAFWCVQTGRLDLATGARGCSWCARMGAGAPVVFRMGVAGKLLTHMSSAVSSSCGPGRLCARSPDMPQGCREPCARARAGPDGGRERRAAGGGGRRRRRAGRGGGGDRGGRRAAAAAQAAARGRRRAHRARPGALSREHQMVRNSTAHTVQRRLRAAFVLRELCSAECRQTASRRAFKVRVVLSGVDALLTLHYHTGPCAPGDGPRWSGARRRAAAPCLPCCSCPGGWKLSSLQGEGRELGGSCAIPTPLRSSLREGAR